LDWNKFIVCGRSWLQAVLILDDLDPLLSMIYHQLHWRAKRFSYWSYTDKDRSGRNWWNV